MKKALFRGVAYPQDALPSRTLKTKPALSPKSLKVIRAGLPSTSRFAFTQDQVGRAKTEAAKEKDPLADPHPEIVNPVTKRFASLLTDGIRTVALCFSSGTESFIQGIQDRLIGTSKTETENIVQKLLQSVDFNPPKKGFLEDNATFNARYQVFCNQVGSVLALLKKEELLALVDAPKTGLTEAEKPLVRDCIDFFIEDHHSVTPFFELSSATLKKLFNQVLPLAKEKLSKAPTVEKVANNLNQTLATNFVRRAGAAEDANIAPKQGTDWSEKLLYPLLDELEKDKDFLQAREDVRKMAIARGIPGAKGFSLAQIIRAEKRMDREGNFIFDPITIYLRNNKKRLEPYLRPLLASLVPADLKDYTIQDLIPDTYDTTWDYLSQITESPRLMGLLMREQERSENPAYRFMDFLEKRKDFQQILEQKNIVALDKYFKEHLGDPEFANLLTPVLKSFQSPADGVKEFDLTIDILYDKYKNRLFDPQPLFRNNFSGLMRSEAFQTLLRPILLEFDPYSVAKSIQELHSDNLSILTEASFRRRMGESFDFEEKVKALIFHFLTPAEKGELSALSGLELLDRFKDQLFAPNFYVSLFFQNTIRRTDPLIEKTLEILAPALVGDLLLRLQTLDHQPVVRDDVQVERKIFKGFAESAALRLHPHVEGLMAVDGMTTQNALTTFQQNKKALHPHLQFRQIKGMSPQEKVAEQHVYALREILEKDPKFLEARSALRAIAKQKGVSDQKGHSIAQLINEEQKLDKRGQPIFDPVTAYLLENQAQLKANLLPLLLSLLPPQFKDFSLEQILADPDRPITKIAQSPHFMGLLMREDLNQFSKQLVKQLRTNFLTDAEKSRLIGILWDRKEELLPLLGLQQQLLDNLFDNKEEFVELGKSLLEGLLGVGREKLAEAILVQLSDLSAPAKFQKMLLSAIPAIANTLKPVVLSKLFLQKAATDDETARALLNYLQNRQVTIGPEILKFANSLTGVTFKPEQIIEVEKSLRQKLSIIETTDLAKFKEELKNFEEEKNDPKDDFSDYLVKQGFSGKLYEDLTPGMKRENFDLFAKKIRAKFTKPISDEGFKQVCDRVYKVLEKAELNGLRSKAAIAKMGQFGLTKSTAYRPLLEVLITKVTRTAFPKVGTFTDAALATAQMVFAPVDMVNNLVVEAVKPILEGEDPVANLSQLLQPALLDVLNRDFFAKKEADGAPNLEDFKKSSAELGKLFELLAVPGTMSTVFEFFINPVFYNDKKKSTAEYIAETIAQMLFDLTDQAWKNENLILHLISALQEQLEPAEA